MPKEQIRKRGRRKPKTETEIEAVPDVVVVEGPVPVAASVQEVAAPPATAPGIHPSRLSLISGKPSKSNRAPQQTHQASQPTPVAQSSVTAPTPEGAPQEEATLEWSRQPDPEFPFGVLDPDVKAYFRNVEERIRDWEGVSSTGEEREDRQMFLSSVLTELRESELTVSTDPDTAVVLERLLPSLGDWGRRVVGDAIGDNWDLLLRHRFGSHVAQTWFTLAADTLDRESKGIYPPQQAAQASSSSDVGELPTMTTLLSTILKSVQQSIPQLLVSPHASPPLRLLLLVLTPNRPLPSLDGSSDGLIRSKKSNKYRKGHGVQGKSIFVDENSQSQSVKGKGKAREVEEVILRGVPEELVELRREVRRGLITRLGSADWKSMGVDAVGSAAVQLILEFEVEDGDSEKEGSLIDHLTEGMVSKLANPSETSFETQPFLLALQSSQTGTRLFETLLRVSPEKIFQTLWSTYFVGKIGRLAAHPYANFVVAKAVSRLDKAGVEEVIRECGAVSGGRGLIKTARTSVLQGLVDRAVVLGQCEKAVIALIISALDLPEKDTKSLVPCLMALKTYPTYQSILTGTPLEEDLPSLPSDLVDEEAEKTAASAAGLAAWQNRRKARPEGGLGANMQGCLLLQAMIGLGNGGNDVVVDSLLAQPLETIVTYCKSPISSHFIDIFLTSPSTQPKSKRRLLLLLFPSSTNPSNTYLQLSKDKLGSRVIDTIWSIADGYMKEKIAKSLIPYKLDLGGDEYGRWFGKKLELHLLERRPEEWREKVLGVEHHFKHEKKWGVNASATPVREQGRDGVDGEEKIKKRKDDGEKDAIDDLFDGAKKSKRVKV